MTAARGQRAPDALLLDEMFSPRIAERLRALGIDCVAVAGGRVLVTNNVVDFERL